MINLFEIFEKTNKKEKAISYAYEGEVLRQSGENKKALKSANKAVEYDTENSDYYMLRALIKKNLTDLQGALKDINKSIELNPDFNRGYLCRFLINKDLKSEEDAQKDIKLLEENVYNNNLPSLFEALADEELKQANYISAEKYIEKAFAKSKKNEKLIMKKIDIERRNKNFSKALNDAELLISLDENNDEYKRIKEEIEKQIGNIKL